MRLLLVTFIQTRKMAVSTASGTEKSRLSLEAEDKKLLGYSDRSEDELEMTSTYTEEDDPSRRSKKLIPSSSTVRRWISLSLQIICIMFVGGVLGYVLRPGCTEQECIRMTSSYCKWVVVL